MNDRFLWAALQLQQVLKCDTKEAVKEALQKLPPGLDDTYDQIYSEIQTRQNHEQTIAENAIRWVMCAPYPLPNRVLLTAVRIFSENGQVSTKDVVRESTLLSICQNILVLDSAGKWRFSHLSVREYFECHHVTYHFALSHCVRICFQSLHKIYDASEGFNKFTSVKYKQSSSTDENIFDPENEFSVHLSEEWPFYANLLTEDSPETIFVKQWLGSLDKSSPSYTRWVRQPPRKLRYQSPQFRRFREDLSPYDTPIFSIASFSLYELLRKWFENRRIDPYRRNERSQSLLEITAKVNCLPFCEYLVSCGVSPSTIYDQVSFSNAIDWAAVNNNVTLLQRLVCAAGVQIDLLPQTSWNGTAIAAAACKGNLDVVRYLVEEGGVDVDFLHQVGQYGSALAAAACKGNLDIVRYLIEECQANVDLILQAGSHGSALAAAVHSENLDVVQYLVEKAHATVDLLLQVGYYGSALATAAYRKNTEIVQYLVEDCKADVNLLLYAGEYGSALTAATCHGNPEFVQFLVEKCRADVNLLLPAGNHGSALAAAAFYGNFEVVRLLVQGCKADSNLLLQVGDFGSTLVAAIVRSRDLEMIKFLIQEGKADSNLLVQAGDYGSPLVAAAGCGRLDVVQYLVEERNAEVNLPVQVGKYGSSLAAAICSAQLDIVQYLVEEAHADVNLSLPAGPYGSAIAAAANMACLYDIIANGRFMKILQYLIENSGADVNFLPSNRAEYLTPLGIAVEAENMQFVKFFVEEVDADVNLQFRWKEYRNVLQIARSKFDKSIAVYLVSKGAVTGEEVSGI